jgi:nucleoside triphosphate pyrophosphatase
VRPADVEEVGEGPPLDVAVENAYRKAAAVGPGRVLGVDTLVAVGSRLYGKPRDEADARAALAALAGRSHVVVSGLCVMEVGAPPRTATATTTVTFRAAEPALLDWYLASGEWRERAGAYAIQGRGAALVAAIDGDYFNVVGLPVPALLDLLPGLLTSP